MRLLAAGLLLLSQAWAGEVDQKPFRVVVDPGHGGTDHGTIYSHGDIRVAEKEITLKLALEVERLLKLNGVEVLLTRHTDHEMLLGPRTALANRVKASLFLSIHLNSPPPGSTAIAEGIETYILNNASDESSKRLARLENSVLGGSEAEAQGGPTEVALILKDLRLDANLSESKRLACLLQRKLSTDRGAGSDRGVRQALFHVLLGADMPSALVEVGFLSSPKDRSVVLSPSGRKRVARAITRGILEFRDGAGLSKPHPALSSCKVR